PGQSWARQRCRGQGDAGRERPRGPGRGADRGGGAARPSRDEDAAEPRDETAPDGRARRRDGEERRDQLRGPGRDHRGFGDGGRRSRAGEQSEFVQAEDGDPGPRAGRARDRVPRGADAQGCARKGGNGKVGGLEADREVPGAVGVR
ncbi:unnamed protein product, partial [Prorocentrum cordatum]